MQESSFHFDEENVYQQYIQKTRESYMYSIQQQCPSIPPHRLMNLFDFTKTEEPQEQLYRILSASSDTFPREEIPTLLSVLKDLHDENMALKQKVNQMKHVLN